MSDNPIFDRNSKWAVKGPYLTQLSPRDEASFQQWVQKNNVPFDPSPNADYDMRGYWQSGQGGTAVNPNDGKLHFPDTFKTPYHESFSAESKFATPGAPTWNDKDQLIDKNGSVLFDERAKGIAPMSALPDTDAFLEQLHNEVLNRKLPEPPESAINYNFGEGTADNMPNFAPKPKDAPGTPGTYAPVLGGRGMPVMMPSSPPDTDNNVAPTPKTGGSPETPGTWGTGDLPTRAPQGGTDIVSLLRGMFQGAL